jgi:hypothetical protein
MLEKRGTKGENERGVDGGDARDDDVFDWGDPGVLCGSFLDMICRLSNILCLRFHLG